MTYHLGCMLTPFFCEIPEEVRPIFPALTTGGWLFGVGKKQGKERLRLKTSVESKGMRERSFARVSGLRPGG